jgi:hypothetical protein
MWTVVPDIYNVLTASHIQDPIFSCTYLRCYWRYVYSSASIILQTWCQYSAQTPVQSMRTVVRTYTMYLQLRIFRLQYSTERIWAGIGDISTIKCALYNHGAKYSAHLPDYAIWTVVPDIYNELTAAHVLASIFKWTYPRCYWRYVDNSASIILRAWCQYSSQPPVYSMWTVVPDIYNVFTAPHIQTSIFNWTYLRWDRRYIDN